MQRIHQGTRCVCHPIDARACLPACLALAVNGAHATAAHMVFDSPSDTGQIQLHLQEHYFHSGHDVAEASQEAPGTSACVATGLCANPVIEAMAEEDLPETLHSVLADGFSKIGSMQLREMCSADTGVSDWEDQECEFCKVCGHTMPHLLFSVLCWWTHRHTPIYGRVPEVSTAYLLRRLC